MHFEKFISSDRVCNHGYCIIYGKTHVRRLFLVAISRRFASCVEMDNELNR